MKRKKISLTRQIVDILIFFCFVTTLLVFSSQSILVKRIYKNNKINSLVQTGESVVLNINNNNLDDFINTLTI